MANTYYDDIRTAEEYLQHGEALEKRRAVWQHAWEEITPYVNPRRSFFNNDYSTDDEGRPIAEDVYDSTGIIDATTMRDGMVGYNVGPRIRWAALTLTDPKLVDLPYVKDWLEECERICYLIWSNSNFYMAAGEMVMDAVTIGTATMLMEDPIAPMMLNFQCLHPKEVYIDEVEGKVTLWMRKTWLSGRSMLRRYGQIDGRLDEDYARDQLGDKVYDECVKAPFEKSYKIHHFIHPADDLLIEQPLEGLGDRQWRSVEIMDAYGKDGKKILTPGGREGFYESPMMSWRWEKNSDESYGRSPSLKAKAEILTLNEMGRTMTEATQLFVERPLNVPEELRGTEKLLPWGKNYYKRDNRKIEPMDLGGAYPVGIDFLQRAEQKIHDHFHADLFKMLTQSERQMTAREINERMGEKVALLSAPLTGQNSEMLAPIVKRTFNIARRNGWLPDPPVALIKAAAQIDVEFIGPLAQAQQRYHQSHNINAGLGTLSAIGQSSGHMEGWDNVDIDELYRHIMDSEGFPQKTIKEIVDRDRVRARRAEEQERQQQMAQMEQAAGIVGDPQKAAEPGSLADTLARTGIPGQP